MAYDLYNFPYSRTYDGDLGYLIHVYNELLKVYKNANLDYSGIQSELDTVKANLEKQVSKEDKDYKELKGKIETIEAYLGTGTGTLQETLTQIQTDITSLKSKYETVYSKVLNLETSATQVTEEFTQRFIEDETKITNLQNDTRKLKTRMTTAENSIAENTLNISSANKEIETTNNRIDNLENSISSAKLPILVKYFKSSLSNTDKNLPKVFFIGTKVFLNGAFNGTIPSTPITVSLRESYFGYQTAFYILGVSGDWLNIDKTSIYQSGTCLFIDRTTNNVAFNSTIICDFDVQESRSILRFLIPISQEKYNSLIGNTYDLLLNCSIDFS